MSRKIDLELNSNGENYSLEDGEMIIIVFTMKSSMAAWSLRQLLMEPIAQSLQDYFREELDTLLEEFIEEEGPMMIILKPDDDQILLEQVELTVGRKRSHRVLLTPEICQSELYPTVFVIDMEGYEYDYPCRLELEFTS